MVRGLALKVQQFMDIRKDIYLISIIFQFIVDNGKEIVAQPGWREKLKV